MSDRGVPPAENPTDVEVFLKDFLSWCREPTGSKMGIPRFTTSDEWEGWFENGAFIRADALGLFEAMTAARLGTDDEDRQV